MQIELWIAVCHDFHSARGPWITPEKALKEAKRLTAESSSNCVYIPVVLKTEGKILGEETLLEAGEKSTTTDYDLPVGQYL